MGGTRLEVVAIPVAELVISERLPPIGVTDDDLAAKGAEAAGAAGSDLLGRGGGAQRGDRPAAAGDDDFFAAGDGVDKFGQVGLRLGDADDAGHGTIVTGQREGLRGAPPGV